MKFCINDRRFPESFLSDQRLECQGKYILPEGWIKEYNIILHLGPFQKTYGILMMDSYRLPRVYF